MKPSPNFSKNKKTKVTNLSDELEEYKSRIVELGMELEVLSSDLERKIRQRIENGTEDAHKFVISIAREHFQGREDKILARMYEWLKQPIFWDHEVIYGASTTKKEVEDLTKQGYTYCHTVYDPEAKDITKRHGALYRRPKIPGSFGEFKEMYERYVLATAESKKKRKETLERREAASRRVDEEVRQAERKKRKLDKKKAEDQAT